MTNMHDTWPNPERPGEPLNPTHTGPHALIDKNGKSIWAWWMYHPSGASTWMLAEYNGLQTSPSGLVHKGFSYLGPAEMPQDK
ncbi:hypothetical protein [Acetobacter pasteurianus]|uniref:hypothetical protein n=1 Tax=Acetobacter pasteurianus TaxID=438 RepID=UPI0002E49B4E|nr:hypothetical protein [Acetobacter pasteurianus]KDE21229.1 hypothetical protein AZ09_03805 [Acetobacter aceti 1023]GCD65305.1 hypothetical protein NBRC3279_0796 [Acetobacter pasteurianus NBRC 3279]GCD71615.1 hypothetical protein NBRC3284_0771 [Acetobacter pasteurianus NBRC 3284]